MRAATLLTTLALALPASASNILVLSSGDAGTDNAALAALRSRGHSCTLGAPFYQQTFTAQSLAPYQTVYLQANNNWYLGEISAVAGLNLRTWVQNGGRLVTSEWVTYYATPGEAFASIESILPLTPTTDYGTEESTAFYRYVTDPAIDAGVAVNFGIWLDDYTGTQIHTWAKAGATPYYTTPGVHTGLAGWARGSGSVYSFSTTCGPTELTVCQDFAQLFSNVMGPVAYCYANCDGSIFPPLLNVNDFACFMSRFAAGDSYANCDQSTSPPVLNVNDFACFTAHFAAGCPQ
jgi:hypothetical protein